MEEWDYNDILKRNIRIIGHGIVAVVVFCAAAALVILCIPIYLFRFLLIYLAKLVRPDLADALCGMSSMFATDLFSGKAPTCCTVLPITINGNLSKEELQKVVQKNWIDSLEDNGKDFKYPQFKQFVYYWFGFPFWKNDPNFNVKNHVHDYAERVGKPAGEIVTEEELDTIVEKLLNTQFPTGRSPWELYIVENYRTDKFEAATSKDLSVILMRVQHCMVDGFSLLDALVGGLLEFDLNNLSLPKMSYPKRTFWQKLIYNVTLPILGAMELTEKFSNLLRECPWKIRDADKQYYHRYAKSELISIDQMKHVKNVLGVSFTSVLLSGISAGIYKSLDAQRRNNTLRVKKEDDHMLCLTAIPLPETEASRKRRLKNHSTGLVFYIPCNKFPTSLDRLRKCDEILAACKKSVTPLVALGFTRAVGWLFGNLPYIVGKNRLMSTGLTTFPTKQKADKDKIGKIGGREVLFAEFATGTLVGDCGVAFMAISFYPYIRLMVTAEAGVLSKKEIKDLVKYVEEELRLLYSIANTIQPINQPT